MYKPCSECGCETNRTDAFGEPLCSDCHEAEDESVDAWESSKEL